MSVPTPYVYRALVTSVYDGDTVTATIDLGMAISVVASCRLLDIDAPEMHGKVAGEKEAAEKARNRLREIVLNKWVTLHSVAKPDKYGRLLVNLWSDESGLVNEILLKEGLVVAYNGGTRQAWVPSI